MLKGVVISAVLSLMWIGIQIALFHCRRPARMFAVIVSLFLLTVPLVPLVFCATPANLFFLPRECIRTPLALGIIIGLLTHILIFFSYVEFFYYIDRSVTLRMLVELWKRPGCTFDHFRREYNVEDMVLRRMDAMRENGFVAETNGRWRLTYRGRLFAGVCSLTRRMFNLRPGQ